MKFSKEKHLTFEEAVEIMFRQLGDWKIMALATSVNDHVICQKCKLPVLRQ